MTTRLTWFAYDPVELHGSAAAARVLQRANRTSAGPAKPGRMEATGSPTTGDREGVGALTLPETPTG